MRRLVLTLGILLMLLTACGVKGKLQPKGKPIPTAPSVLNLQQQGASLLMNWDIPTVNQDGSALTDLAGFRVDLYTYTPESYCPECRDQQTIANIDLESPGPARLVDGQLYFRDSELAFDRGYRYRIIPVTAGGKSGPGIESRRQIHRPPAAPIEVKAEALDKGMRIFWSIPEGTIDKGDLVGVNIYRGLDRQALHPEPVNPEPVSGNNFEQFGLGNNQLYRLGLRAVIRVDEDLVESDLSTIVEVTPQAGL